MFALRNKGLMVGQTLPYCGLGVHQEVFGKITVVMATEQGPGANRKPSKMPFCAFTGYQVIKEMGALRCLM